MTELTKKQRREIVGYLESGQDIPDDFKHLLFPPERGEYELVYADKERAEDIVANTWGVPLQAIKTFNLTKKALRLEWINRLIFGDNLQVMKRLLDDPLVKGKVKLVYIDPPFATKKDFKGSQDQKAYQDKILGAQFIEFLRKRIILIRELLSPDGSIYIHLDSRKCHYIKAIMDELFSSWDFAEIIWICGLMGSGQYYPKAHETILCYKSKNAFFRAPARLGLSTRITGALQKDDSGWFYTRGKESSGGETFLKTYISKNPSFSKEEAIFEANIERPQPAWDVWIGKDKLAKAYNDHPVGTYAYTKTGNVGYPTQKPESLLARIIHASSQDDDIILDAFAGSGTTLTVAEKLGRRWIGIDCGKLAIYTMQKRLMNLKKEIGQKGQTLKAKPFTLYNAGLYDFKRMSELPWEDYRLFALQLFQVRDKKHALAGIELDGFKNDADVLVFNFKQDGGIVVDEEYVAELNRHFGSRTRDEFYIIAPASRVTFLEDYIDHGPTRYYILRIPYSIIDELHNRPFEQIRQPVDETEINNTVEAVGFDFIIPPTVKAHYSLEKPKGELYDVVTITIEKFTSEVMTKKPRKFENRETLSMVMVDYSYAGNGNGIFDLDAVFYRGDIEKDKWKVRLDAMQFGERIMIIYMDIFGNELREVKTPLDFGIKANRVREDTAPYGKSKRTTKKSKTAKVKKKAASNIPTKKKAVKSKRKTAKKAAQRRSNR